MKGSTWVLLAASGVFAIIADTIAKLWSLNSDGPRGRLLWLCAIAFYQLASVAYVGTLKADGLVKTSLVWSVFTTFGFLLVGMVGFRASLTATQAVGVAFGSVSLACFMLGR